MTKLKWSTVHWHLSMCFRQWMIQRVMSLLLWWTAVTYQQTPDQSPDVVGHVGRPSVTGGQFDQSHKEVFTLFHTLQCLLYRTWHLTISCAILNSLIIISSLRSPSRTKCCFLCLLQAKTLDYAAGFLKNPHTICRVFMQFHTMKRRE